jgi:hypothetical protein
MSTLNTYNLKSPDSASTNLALDASGNVAIQTGSASAPSIYVTGDANTGIYSPGGDQVALTTGGSARLYISSSGQVGIGTTSANAKLVVSNGGAGGLEVSPDNSSATIYSYNRSTSSYIEQRYDGSSHIFQVGGSSHERARIDSSGRLLVGTSTSITSAGTSGGGAGSTPALQVVHPYQNVNPAGISLSRFQASNPYGAVFTIQKSKNDTIGSHAVVASGDELGVISFDGSNGTAFNTAATISAVVDGTPGANDMPGRLVFSTTADGASSPTERMRITNDGTHYTRGTTSVFSFASNAAAGTTNWLQLGGHSATSITGYTISYAVYTNGNVVNTNGSYTAISDAKLKENIVDASSQWDDIKAIQIRNWNFKEETGHETHRQIGPIAQELEQVCPGLVFETPDRDAEGNETGEVTKGVNQSVLYMKAVKALQEAMERIETLEAKVAALEGV